MVDEELHFLLIQCYNYNNRLLARKTMAAGLHLLPASPRSSNASGRPTGAPRGT